MSENFSEMEIAVRAAQRDLAKVGLSIGLLKTASPEVLYRLQADRIPLAWHSPITNQLSYCGIPVEMRRALRYRPQRGALAESMKEAREFTRLADFLEHLGAPAYRVQVKPYAFDHRIRWSAHLVTIDGEAVGFTDGPIDVLRG